MPSSVVSETRQRKLTKAGLKEIGCLILRFGGFDRSLIFHPDATRLSKAAFDDHQQSGFPLSNWEQLGECSNPKGQA